MTRRLCLAVVIMSAAGCADSTEQTAPVVAEAAVASVDDIAEPMESVPITASDSASESPHTALSERPEDPPENEDVADDRSALNWKLFTEEDARFEVKFPGAPQFTVHRNNDSDQEQRSFHVQLPASDVRLTVEWAPLHSEADRESLLQGMRLAFSGSHASADEIQLDGLRGLDIRIRQPDRGYTERRLILLTQKATLTATAAGPTKQFTSVDLQPFFDSVRVPRPVADTPAPVQLSDLSGRKFTFDRQSDWPPLFEAAPVTVSPRGLRVGRRYVRTVAKQFLNHDFRFEVWFNMQQGDSITFIGIGEGRGTGSYKEPAKSVHMRIHHESIGGVGLAKDGQIFGGKRIGRGLPNGDHRAIVEKHGSEISFAIDVDDDGPTPDDMTLVIPNLNEFAPFLHEKNSHLFLGGGSGITAIRLTMNPDHIAPPTPPPANSPAIRNEDHRLGAGHPWPDFLVGGPVTATEDGVVSSTDIATRATSFLNHDFRFELLLSLQEEDGIALAGLGRSREEASVFLRMHHEALHSGVGLAKSGQRTGTQKIGDSLPTGTHRIVIEKAGRRVTFSIDVHNDSPEQPEIQTTVPDITVFEPAMHSKNVRLFFGNAGTWQHVKLEVRNQQENQ